MLRELSRLLEELHEGLLAVEARGGVQLSGVEMTLPLELRPVLRDGGCVLLADVPRRLGSDDWTASPSRLCLAWQQADASGEGVRVDGGGRP
ncbi:hypothetical protein [Marilutibacter spongiae]|uniref:Uncharacterized protein n=1 Tax=Marilutibacter spongiae TaxID=2025720 RepID=A0A7W3Y5W1_9GAMM|nr:hypothetical protein [Lysobacter spongiae]MBB1060602.1 hypothetical protein [Lysobacter spongiae]